MGPVVTINMSSSGSNNTIAVLRLRDDRSNWVDYDDRLKSALGSKGLLKYIEGMAVRPNMLAVKDGEFIVKPRQPATDEEIEVHKKKIEDFDQKEHAARHILKSSVSPSHHATLWQNCFQNLDNHPK